MPLRYLRHALAVEINLTNAFDAREHVINRLAANAHQFRADDARHEIARKIENLLWRRAFEAFAKNCRHGAGKRLHFRTKRHANLRLAVFIDVEINADRVHAFFIFTNIDEVEFFTFAWLLLLRVVRIGNERLAPLIFRQRFEEIDDLAEFFWVGSVGRERCTRPI